MITGRSVDLTILDELDKDGEVRVSISSEIEWLNRDDATKIVDHLTKVFKLDEVTKNEPM